MNVPTAWAAWKQTTQAVFFNLKSRCISDSITLKKENEHGKNLTDK